MNRWHLTEEQKTKFVPILREYFDKLENMTEEEAEKVTYPEITLDLSDEGISPYLLKELLEDEFGYEEENYDRNGWQWDFWWTMKRKDGKSFPSTCETMMICGCGATFELVLRPDEL